MYKIELNKEELNNLKVFYGRVDLKGQEVPAFVAVLNKINNAKEIKEDTK